MLTSDRPTRRAQSLSARTSRFRLSSPPILSPAYGIEQSGSLAEDGYRHPRWTRFLDGSLSTASWTLSFRSTSVSTPPVTTSPQVSKERQYVDASELSRTAKKPALRATSPSVDYQTIVDGVLKALDLRDRGRTAEVNTVQATNSTATTGNRNKKTPPRQGSPPSSNSSVGSFSSRAFSTGRTVRFQDQEDTRSSNQGYGLSAGSRWQGNQSPQGSTNGPRPWVNYRQPGQGTPRPQPPSLRAGWSPRQGGPRFPPPQSGGQWMPGQGGPRLRPPTQGNAGN